MSKVTNVLTSTINIDGVDIRPGETVDGSKINLEGPAAVAFLHTGGITVEGGKKSEKDKPTVKTLSHG